MKNSNRENNKINETSRSVFIGVLLCSIILSGCVISIKKVDAQDIVSNDISILNVQEEDIARGMYGSSRWRIDAEGTLYIGEGKLSVYYPTNMYRSYWQPYSAQIKSIIFEGEVIANENSKGLFQELGQVKKFIIYHI